MYRSGITGRVPDITDGSQVTVTDSAGKVIGTGTLSYSKSQTDAQALVLSTAMGLGASADDLVLDIAVYTFTVTGLPGGEARYGFTAGTNRGNNLGGAGAGEGSVTDARVAIVVTAEPRAVRG